MNLQFSFAQPAFTDLQAWAKTLNTKDYKAGNTAVDTVFSAIHGLSKTRVFNILDSLESVGNSEEPYFRPRFNVLKASLVIDKLIPKNFPLDLPPSEIDSIRRVIRVLYSNAMDLAYEREDEKLIAWVSYFYGSSNSRLDDTGPAIMYAKKGIDLSEKLNLPFTGGAYQFLATALFHVKEYDESRVYSKKATTLWQASPNEDKGSTINCINTTAMTFHMQDVYDSALFYYSKALQYAKKSNNTVWIGIVSGNIGKVYYALGKYDSARNLLEMDYQKSKQEGLYHNAANSLQWIARTDLAMDDKQKALPKVREAFQLLRLWPDPAYLRNTYNTATQVFKEMREYDSAFYYNNLWASLNDSLEKIVASNSLAITSARLNDETSRYKIQSLNRQKRTEILQRNLIIVAIVGLSILGILIVNWKRTKEKLRAEKVIQEKQTIEKEMAEAAEQLKLFTKNIVEKTNLIEKLERQVKDKEEASEQHNIISELTQQTILTEDEWQRFRSLFEKIHPGFFFKLQEKFPDITVAEQRMASLIRLHLTSKQMASMQGVSVDSVHKTRQRLRQRLLVTNNNEVEKTIGAI